jgi:hypothetical protein
MIGVRFPDGEYVDRPGGYSKYQFAEEVCWMICVPTGGRPFLIGRRNRDGSPYHWVRENEDGTITVEPNPPDAPDDRRNSNSIQFNGWHGYIRDGVWEALPDSA